MDSRTVSEANKPVLDEQMLAKLLEAAYVLQEHNREMRDLELRVELKRDAVEAKGRAQSELNPPQPAAFPEPEPTPTPVASEPGPAPDYTQILGKIVEIQHHIQTRRLQLENVLKLVAERVVELANASGSAIGIVDGKNVRYRATAGLSTPPQRTIPSNKALFLPCVKTRQVLRCTHVNAEFLVDAEECQKRGIESLVAVPVFHEGEVAGGLELYYSSANRFTEQDVHTCQLMAGLITEALAREEEANWKKSLADERAAMLEALEKLQPNLAALIEKPAAKAAPSAQPDSAAAPAYSCPKCGHQLMSEEQFCGRCGTPRAGDYEPPTLQSKVASFWHMQEAQQAEAVADLSPGSATPENASTTPDSVQNDESLASSLEKQIPELFSDSDLEVATETIPAEIPLRMDETAAVEDDAAVTEEAGTTDESSETPQVPATTQLTRPADWSSAASAREFLEQLAGKRRQGMWARVWNSHRGDIYLAIAVVLVMAVIRWGIWSDHAVRATSPATKSATEQKSRDSDLSFFDRMLVGMGLAEAPETPEDKGSPGVQVWVDLRTALYYCPGADLYGKTPKGKFTTQREAQLDQFEPAYRKACN